MASLIEPLKKSQATNSWAWFRDHDETISLRTTLRDTKTGKRSVPQAKGEIAWKRRGGLFSSSLVPLAGELSNKLTGAFLVGCY